MATDIPKEAVLAILPMIGLILERNTLPLLIPSSKKVWAQRALECTAYGLIFVAVSFIIAFLLAESIEYGFGLLGVVYSDSPRVLGIESPGTAEYVATGITALLLLWAVPGLIMELPRFGGRIFT